MRSPLQGGLPSVDTVVGAVVEIACDESGLSGTNLLHPASPVITHASAGLRAREAVEPFRTKRRRWAFWSGDDRRQVLVTHDEQSALTAGRLRHLQQVLADGACSLPPAGASETGSAPAGISPLAGLLMAGSRDDPQV